MGRDYAIGQFGAYYIVVDVGVHVGDDGPARLEPPDPGQRVAYAEVAWMRREAQTVNDPQFEIFEVAPASGWDVADVRCIGGGANAIAKC